MTHIHSFAPFAGSDATRLILGTMPGRASLSAQQYYAHPRNLFWRMIEEVLAIPAALPFAARCEALLQQQVAIWDVLHTCTRSSSLDADIDPASIVPNDFAAFLAAHQKITAIFFNGATAEQLFRRHVLQTLPTPLAHIQLVRLPSTSPANASITYASKVAQWRQLNSACTPH